MVLGKQANMSYPSGYDLDSGTTQFDLLHLYVCSLRNEQCTLNM